MFYVSPFQGYFFYLSAYYNGFSPIVISFVLLGLQINPYFDVFYQIIKLNMVRRQGWYYYLTAMELIPTLTS